MMMIVDNHAFDAVQIQTELFQTFVDQRRNISTVVLFAREAFLGHGE